LQSTLPIDLSTRLTLRNWEGHLNGGRDISDGDESNDGRVTIPLIETSSPSFGGSRNRVLIYGLWFDVIDEKSVVSRVISDIGNDQGGRILTINSHNLRQIRSNKTRDVDWGSAELVVADGMPIVWTSRLLSKPLPERVAGSALIWSLTEAASQSDASIFLLGGNPNAAEVATKVLLEAFPSLRIAGSYRPEFGYESNPAAIAHTISAVVEANPSICFCGLGFPKQEILITELRKHLPQTWFLGVGISISLVAGEFRRAPNWVRRAGFEWLFRLVQEPSRLAKRYLVWDLPFVIRMLGSSAIRPSSHAQDAFINSD
jgi:N-acetylglucosaminyldiphosphoundecaprenol N-acetyl-beta-D-mannosaminyltransferase